MTNNNTTTEKTVLLSDELTLAGNIPDDNGDWYIRDKKSDKIVAKSSSQEIGEELTHRQNNYPALVEALRHVKRMIEQNNIYDYFDTPIIWEALQSAESQYD